jgi:hypothetical protein
MLILTTYFHSIGDLRNRAAKSKQLTPVYKVQYKKHFHLVMSYSALKDRRLKLFLCFVSQLLIFTYTFESLLNYFAMTEGY